jgi:glyoxylase-like metal-dependent hydrolase (beta-lactamase superfamily II)
MRSRIKVALIVAGLIVAVPTILLLPAHVQVRSVEPPLPTLEQLRSLLHRPDGPVALRYINTSEQPMAGGTLVHSVFLVEWGNGDVLMIDTGMPADAAERFARQLQRLTDAGPPTVHGSVSRLLGGCLSRIKAVGYTHLHRDHTQGTPEFCAARGETVRLVQTRWQATEHNFGTRAGAKIIRDSCLAGSPLDRDITLDIPEFPGLGVIALGGHTPDSTLFALPVGDTLYLLSGDTTNTRTELLKDIPKARLYSYVLVPEHVKRTAMLRRWLASLDAQPDVRVIVSHDLDDIRASGIPEVGSR